MKKTAWRIAIFCLALVLIAAACLVGVAARKGIGFSEAMYMETKHGHMLLIDNSPIRMSGKDGLFDGLTTGDRVLVMHGLIAESYPGQSSAYLCIKRADGSETDIPVQVLDSLREMGWLETAIPEDPAEPETPAGPPPENQQDAIELAKTQINWDYYAATAEQDPETGEWTVTFWSRSREDFQVVVISSDGNILQVTEGMPWAANP